MMNKSNVPNISVIILNWNGWKDTIECLESLYNINYPFYNVLVIDNCSEDNSVQFIRNYCQGKINVDSRYIKYSIKNKPINILEYTKDDIEKNINHNREDDFFKFPSNKRLILILNDKNYGYAGGNNIGIKFSLNKIISKYVFLLNNDTIIGEEVLNELIEIGEKDKKIGLLGPRICTYNNPLQNQWKFLQNINEIRDDVFMISGAAFLIKYELIKRIGFMDSRFFAYFEDADYCQRVIKAGYKMVYVPTKSIILHKGAGTTKNKSGFKTYLSVRNTIIYYRKHLSNIKFSWFLINFILKSSIFELKKIEKSVRKDFLKGLIGGVFLIFKDKSLLIRRGYVKYNYFNNYI